MDTTLDEIADGIYRISTYVPDIAPPAGFTFNQFLVAAEAPLLFHTGPHKMFTAVADAVARIVPIEDVRYISFGHLEADECGSMNTWLERAPHAEVVFNPTGCLVSLDDLATRAPRRVEGGSTLDLGDRVLRLLETPHVPHNWEAQVLFDETTATLLCGDLFTHVGAGPAVTEQDLVEPALRTDEAFDSNALSPRAGATLRKLASFQPATLAVMHGSSLQGDCARALTELASAYDAWTLDVLERGWGATTAPTGCPAL